MPRTLPEMLRYIVYHGVIGFLAGGVATAIVYYGDFAGIGTLIDNSETGWLVIVMSVIFLGSTFAGVQLAVALYMGSGEDGT